MTADESVNERVIVPLAILEGQSLDEDLAAFLTPLEVHLLGYHVVPEQTTPSQMRDQFEEQAQAALDAMVRDIEQAGGAAASRLVFTHDVDQSIQRVAAELGATARVYPNPVAPVESILAVLGSAIDPTRLGAFLGLLRSDRSIDITVLVIPGDDPVEDARVDTLRAALSDSEVPPNVIEIRRAEKKPFDDEIIQMSIAHDVTVMGQHRANWRSILFGDIEERVAAESVGPVVEILDSTVGES